MCTLQRLRSAYVEPPRMDEMTMDEMTMDEMTMDEMTMDEMGIASSRTYQNVGDFGGQIQNHALIRIPPAAY
jgi:hypothetical protein